MKKTGAKARIFVLAIGVVLAGCQQQEASTPIAAPASSATQATLATADTAPATDEAALLQQEKTLRVACQKEDCSAYFKVMNELSKLGYTSDYPGGPLHKRPVLAPKPTAVPAPEAMASKDFGPRIKGLALGMNQDAFATTAAGLGSSTTPPFASQELIDGSVANDLTHGANSVLMVNQLEQSFPAIQKLGCRPNLETGMNGTGNWWVFGPGPGFEMNGTVYCPLQAHFDADGHADFIYFEDNFAVHIFGAERMSYSEYMQALVDHYDIPGLQTRTSHMATGLGMIEGSSGTYESPDGWRIEVVGHSISLRRVAPSGGRFN
ncbi:hypothetical protein [Dyella sp. 20L07]|uniref:hypothetical protein n=1 Tax=Dyella sp. 20L07 TaxID=3384240 RepID=UPI003D2DE7A9